jgi:calcium/calmodulin-dependent protein kinase kinase 2
MEGILGSASRIVQPPLSIRPSALRKSKSQDTDDRRPIESALIAEGVHREIMVDDNLRRVPQSIDEVATAKPGLRDAVVGSKPPSKGPITSSPIAPQPVAITDAKVIHENMSFRPSHQPISIPTIPVHSGPSTPTHGKGHAHDPLEDTLFLNIGTGEDFPEQSDQPIVSESPSNVDINVYEAAYQEEINRIMKRRESDPRGRQPTLYMTRRVENAMSLKDSELIVDSGRTRDELKANIKALAKKAQKGLEDRAELERLAGKAGLFSKAHKTWGEFERKLDEAREIVREEERRDGKRTDTKSDTASRSSTPGAKGPSRSATPVSEKQKVSVGP